MTAAERPGGVPAEPGYGGVRREGRGRVSLVRVGRGRTCGGSSFRCIGSLIVKLVVRVKLLPTPLQAAALEATLH
ncbi:hypothetical protein, partial [Streptomyces sp. NPDC017964]|uniref:hypothetical protein n=1 Tax=Streptomyces sp. NPDC017964 TaxID=3365022 RepID=UPI0037A8EC84